MSGKWVIWKHDCITDGQGAGMPCDPPCGDPWQVDAPTPSAGKTFTTWVDAFAWAHKEWNGQA